MAVNPLGPIVVPVDDNGKGVYAVSSSLNLAASAVVKASAGRAVRVNVIVAGSAVGAIHDIDTVGAAAAGNKVMVVPNTVGVYDLMWPCATGIVYVVGTGQTVAVSYN
jgi:hypothetical protein